MGAPKGETKAFKPGESEEIVQDNQMPQELLKEKLYTQSETERLLLKTKIQSKVDTREFNLSKKRTGEWLQSNVNAAKEVIGCYQLLDDPSKQWFDQVKNILQEFANLETLDSQKWTAMKKEHRDELSKKDGALNFLLAWKACAEKFPELKEGKNKTINPTNSKLESISLMVGKTRKVKDRFTETKSEEPIAPIAKIPPGPVVEKAPAPTVEITDKSWTSVLGEFLNTKNPAPEKTPEQIPQILTAVNYKNIATLDEKKIPEYFATLKKAVEKGQLTMTDIVKNIFPQDVEDAISICHTDEYGEMLNNQIRKAASREHNNSSARELRLADKFVEFAPNRARYFQVFKAYAETFGEHIDWQKNAYVFTDKKVGSIPPDNRLDRGHKTALDVFFNPLERDGKKQIGPELQTIGSGIVVATADDWEGDTTRKSYVKGGFNGPLAGNGVMLFNPMRNEFYYYAHMHGDMKFKLGDFVEAGQVLGKAGNTGTKALRPGRGNHVHLEIQKYDPEKNTVENINCHEVRRRVVIEKQREN